MTGAWRRLGRLDLDTSRASWAATHAALPIPERAGPGEWNVYLSLRDGEGRARIGRTRLTLDPVPALAPLDADPILDLGERGTFDDSGVVSACLVAVAERRWLFYTGWSRGVTVPFYLGVGLAVSDRGGPFRRMSRAPVLERVDAEPFVTASPAVLHEGGRWRMWYVSGGGWLDGPKPEPRYNIRFTESADGISWERPGQVCVDYGPGEHAFGRPWVLHDGSHYRMWFSVRGDRYRIGYAESMDGIAWVRTAEEAGLRPAGNDWESEMVEYPCLLDEGGRRYMLYNGNDYGRTGVGLAVWSPAGDLR